VEIAEQYVRSSMTNETEIAQVAISRQLHICLFPISSPSPLSDHLIASHVHSKNLTTSLGKMRCWESRGGALGNGKESGEQFFCIET